jgi:hypothetical protein
MKNNLVKNPTFYKIYTMNFAVTAVQINKKSVTIVII